MAEGEEHQDPHYHTIRCVVCGTQDSKVWYASLTQDWCERHVPEEFKLACERKKAQRYG